MIDWRKEFELDPDSAQRIANVIEGNPMSLEHCADILEAVAPLCTSLTTEGFLRRMEALYGDLLSGNYTLRPAPIGKDTLVLMR